MSYNSEELDKALNELKERDLYIAKMMAVSFCTLVHNLLGPYLTSEQRRLYKELRSKKLHATQEELRAAQTLESVFQVVEKFDKEAADFTKGEKVDTADKAMEIAHSFIKKYSPVALPMKAEREGDVWLVDVDIGALTVKMAKVKVDARTGDILSYEIPPK